MSLSVCVDSVGSLLDGFDRSMRNPYDTDVFREMLEDRRQVLRDCQSVVKEMRAAGGAAEGLGFRAVPSVKDLCSRGLSFYGALP